MSGASLSAEPRDVAAWTGEALDEPLADRNRHCPVSAWIEHRDLAVRQRIVVGGLEAAARRDKGARVRVVAARLGNKRGRQLGRGRSGIQAKKREGGEGRNGQPGHGSLRLMVRVAMIGAILLDPKPRHCAEQITYSIRWRTSAIHSNSANLPRREEMLPC